MFTLTTALSTRSSHFGCALMSQRLPSAVIVARVATHLAVRSGLMYDHSCCDNPRFFASGTFVRDVPSRKCVCEIPFIVMVKHLPMFSFIL